MNRRIVGALMGAVVLAGGGLTVSAWAAGGVAPFITAAVSDPGRPKADTDRDADRKPTEVVAFAGVKPGMKVIELRWGKKAQERFGKTLLEQIEALSQEEYQKLTALSGSEIKKYLQYKGSIPDGEFYTLFTDLPADRVVTTPELGW